MIDVDEVDKVSESALLSSISKKRKEMIEVASVCGITDRKTVRYSMELDVLINLYQQFLMKRKKVVSR